MNKTINTQQQNTELNENNKKLIYGLPITIQTKQEHNQETTRARAYFKDKKKANIESKKREITRAREQIKNFLQEIKTIRAEKFKSNSYKDWVLKVRERNKEYKIIENEDSIKIK